MAKPFNRGCCRPSTLWNSDNWKRGGGIKTSQDREVVLTENSVFDTHDDLRLTESSSQENVFITTQIGESELSIGHFFKTQPGPTHVSLDSTQPNPPENFFSTHPTHAVMGSSFLSRKKVNKQWKSFVHSRQVQRLMLAKIAVNFWNAAYSLFSDQFSNTKFALFRLITSSSSSVFRSKMREK